MDSTQHRNPSSLPLDQLVAHALSELDKINYSRRSVRRYRTVWEHLVAFSREMNFGDRFSDQLATAFLSTHRWQPGERVKANEAWRRHIPFVLKVLGNFARDGRVEHTRIETSRLQVPAAMKRSFSDYEQYARDRCYLRASSLRERMRTIAVFMDYLSSRDVTTLDRAEGADIAAFVSSRGRLGPRAASRTVSNIRCFLQFLLMRGTVQQDLAAVLPTIRVPRDSTIPSVWDPELLMKLLSVVDRSSPRGKRDYAILLLACRLGLRLGDIRTLTLDDLKWDMAAIEIKQSKTQAPLCLPMTEEVGEALIDYLKLGRPQTAYRELFLRARPPFAPFVKDSHCQHIVKYWRELAGIQFRSKQHGGLHSLRHTLATQLLREETTIHVISEILGHATSASTMIYAKADVESLRAAALNTEEADHHD